jgi:hypothetical protein
LENGFSCFALIQIANTKRSEHNYDWNFDHGIFDHWSLGICPNLVNSGGFQETPEQSEKRES